MKYLVTTQEVYSQEVLIEADSPEEAIEKVEQGKGEEGELEYNCTLDHDSWTVKENPDG